MSRRYSEQGAALLSVLILVAVIGALTAGLFDRMRLATHLASNAAGQQLARTLAISAETLLLARLDAATANPPTGRFTLPLAGAGATAELADATGCFNLNSLVVGRLGQTLPRFAAVAQFGRLLVALDIGAAEADHLAAATADWIDSDDIALPGGAEDAVYARAGTPYRTAGALMAETSEWRAVAGVTAAVYARARPYLCALPTTDATPVNVNTLTPAQAPVLAALAGRPLTVARDAIAERPAGGWPDVAAFWDSRALASVAPPADSLAQTTTHTAWYSATVSVTGFGTDFFETALIDARRVPTRLVIRRWTEEE